MANLKEVSSHEYEEVDGIRVSGRAVEVTYEKLSVPSPHQPVPACEDISTAGEEGGGVYYNIPGNQ